MPTASGPQSGEAECAYDHDQPAVHRHFDFEAPENAECLGGKEWQIRQQPDSWGSQAFGQRYMRQAGDSW
jgi:hypothetical protein